MNFYNAFMEAFGGLTLGTVIIIIGAFIFLALGYKKFKEYLFKKHDLEQQYKNDLAEALAGVRKYPEYREQSHEIQLALKSDIRDINLKYDSLSLEVTRLSNKINKMEEADRKKDLSILKDKIIERYKFYTDPEINPTQSWNEMEAESFWELFHEYESRGGNGYMHSEVEPKMTALKVLKVGQPPFVN